MVLRPLILAGLLIWGGSARPALAQEGHANLAAPFTAMSDLDLDLYAGTWFEIARFPNRYQRNCGAILAEYRPRPDGNYDVRGTCPNRQPGRRATTMDGVARVDGPAELSIGLTSWMPLFRRSVFVLDIAPDYSVAVIGEPRRKYAWIMARSTQLTTAQFDRAADVLRANGFAPELLERLPPADIAQAD